jgi:hypothetical protein
VVEVISVELARRLRDAGVKWQPGNGDRFVVADRDMDEDVFVISDMLVDLHRLPDGPVLGFNGTVEWALDSVNLQQSVWLPREGQLRELLGRTFRRFERADGRYRVVLEVNGRDAQFEDEDAEQAYGLALLHLVED